MNHRQHTRRHVDRKRHIGLWLSMGTALALLVTGCSPSTQHAVTRTPGQLQSLSLGQPAQSGWTPLSAASVKGEQLQQYVVNTAASVMNGRDRNSLSISGQVNAPDKALLTISLNGLSGLFYQQGNAAFQSINGKWMASSPIGNVNLFPAYTKLINAAQSAGLTIEKFPRQYVIDEYCAVYEASIPAALVKTSGVTESVGATTATGTSAPATGDVLFAFYVGQRTGVLREVAYTTSSSSAQTNFTTTVNTQFGDLNQPGAQVHIPQTLLHKISGLS